MNKLPVIFLIFCFFSLYGYEKPEHVSQKVWEQVSPYFLPDDHPVKSFLDDTFSKSRPLHSKEEMKSAGFNLLEEKEYDLIVAKFRDYPRYLIKFYYDYHEISRFGTRGEWPLWIKRIEGVERIKRSIAAHKYEHLIKVPRKWIYPLSPDACAPLAYSDGKKNFRKNFILVEEDMEIVSPEVNKAMYQNMSEEMLVALYTVLNETQLYDSVYIDNNPFSKDGRIAFVDTEEFDIKGVLYERITPYLSQSNKTLWRAMISGDYPVNLVEAEGTLPKEAG